MKRALVLALALAAAGAAWAVPTTLYFRAVGDNVGLELSATAPGSGYDADQTIPDGLGGSCVGSGFPSIGGVSVSRIRTFTFVTPETWTKDPDLTQVNFEFWAKLKEGDFTQLTLRVTIKDALDGATWIEQMGVTCPGCVGTACSTGCNLNIASPTCISKFNREAGGNISSGSSIEGTLGSLRASLAAGSTVTVEVWAVAGSGDATFRSSSANKSWIAIPYSRDNFSIRGSISPRYSGLQETKTYTYKVENTDSGAPDITQLNITIPGGLTGNRFFDAVSVSSIGHAYNSYLVTQAAGTSNGSIAIDFTGTPVTSGEVVDIVFSASAPGMMLKNIKWDGVVNPAGGNFSVSQKSTDSLYVAVLTVPSTATITGTTAANTSGDGGALTITWKGPTPYDLYGITAYRVFRASVAVALVPPDGSPAPPYADSSWKPTTQVVSQTTGIQFTDTWLTNTQTYCYMVQGVNAVGNGVFSGTVCGVPYANPRAPTFLSAMVRNNAIELQWSRSVAGYNSWAVSGYWIYRTTCEGCVATSVCATVWAADPASNSVYIDGSLSNASLYTYYVRAFDWLGHFSANSPVATGRPPANIPAALTAMYDYAGTRVALQWQEPTGNIYALNGYNVYRSSCTTCLFGRLVGGAPEVSAGVTVFTDSAVVVGAKYTYAISPVTAEGAGTEGAMTNKVRILVPPSPATALSVSVSGTASLFIGWSPGNPAGTVSGYRVFRANQPESATMFQLAIRNPWTASSYLDTGLSWGSRYYYRVSAFYVHPEGDYAESPPCGAVFGVVRPGRVQSLTGYAYNSAISLSWGDSTTCWEVDGYRIFRASGSVSTATVFVASVAATVFTYDDTTVTNGLTYYFRVAAFNLGGEGDSTFTLGMTPYVPPDPPSGLTVSSGLSALTLEWTPSVMTTFPVSGYVVMRGVASGAEVQVAYVDGPGTSVWIDSTGLVNGTFYYYVIKSIDAMGYISLPSMEDTASPAMPPCPPSGMTGWTSGASVYLTWQPVVTCGAPPTFPVSGYAIYRSTVSGKAYSEVAWLAHQYATSYTDTTVVYGETYYYAARTFDDTKGLSPPNLSVSLIPPYGPAYSAQAVVTPRIPAGPPVNLTFMGEPNEHNLMNKLSWTPATEGTLAIIGYNVHRSTAIGGADTPFYVSGADTGTYLDTNGVVNGKFYYYRVAAVDEKWYEGDWAAACGTPYADPTPPSSLNLAAGDGQVFLWWPGVSMTTWPVSGYQVYRTTYPGVVGLEPAKRVGSTPLFATNFTDTTGITNGTTYYYHVGTWDEWMHLSYLVSPEASGTPFAPPAMVSGLTCIPGDGRVTISWDASAAGTWPVSGYAVYRASWPDIACPGPQISVVTGGLLQYIDNAVVNGQGYHYRVRAWDQCNPANYSLCSATQFASPQANPDPPGEPTNLTGRVADNGNIVLGWTAGTKTALAIAGYNVYRTTWANLAASGGELLAAVGTVTYYLDSTAVLGTVYYYRVRTFDTFVPTALESTPSNEVRSFPSAAPTNPVAGTGVLHVDVDWDAMAAPGDYAVVGYRLFQSTSAVGPWGLVMDAAPDIYADYAVTSGRAAYYRVQNVHSGGWTGPFSAVVSATPSGPPSLPVLAVAPGDKVAHLSWTPSSGSFPPFSYFVYRSTVSGVYAGTYATMGAGTSYDDNYATNGVLFYFQVRAEDSDGPPASVYSSEVPAFPMGIPHSLSASAGDSRVSLWWSRPVNGTAGISAYQVFRKSPTENEGICGTAYGSSTSVYADTTALNGVSYVYRVRAVEAAFSPVWSTAFTNTAGGRPGTPPSAPTITGIFPGSYRLGLTWSPPSAMGSNPLSAYHLYRSSGGQPYALRAWFTPTSSSFLDTTVTNGVQFSYRLRAVDNGFPPLESPLSNTVYGTPFDAPLPPTALTVRFGNGRLYVGWATAFVESTYRVPGFHVYRGTVSNGEVLSPPASGATPVYATGWQDSGLANGVRYFYKVRSVDTKGNQSVTSFEVSGVPFAPPPAPYGVTALPGNKMITLKWSHTPTLSAPWNTTYLPINGYKVYRDDVGYLYRAFGTIFVDTSVTNGTAHVYTVTAVDANGNESPLSWGGTATGSATQVNPPGSVAAVVAPTTITLNWLAPSTPGEAPGGPATEYVILKATCPVGCEYSSSAYVPAGTLTWTDTSTAQGGSYEYRVRALAGDPTVMSPDTWDNWAAYSSACPLPGAPSSIVARAGSHAATVEWTPPAVMPSPPCTINGYVLTRKVAGRPFTTVATLPVGVNMYEDHGLTNGLVYTYRVAARNASGIGAPAESAAITPQLRPTQFYLSKNAFAPVKGERLNIYFSLEEPGTVTVRILSISGLPVYEWKREVPMAGPDLEWNALTTPSTKAGIPDLPGWNGKAADGQYVASGVYLVHISAGKFRKILKVIVIK